MSATTPTTRTHRHSPPSRPSNPVLIRAPTGSPSPKASRAKVSFTTATGSPSASSEGRRARPARSAVPTVRKYPGETACQRTLSGSASETRPTPPRTRSPAPGPAESGPAWVHAAASTPGSAATRSATAP